MPCRYRATPHSVALWALPTAFRDYSILVWDVDFEWGTAGVSAVEVAVAEAAAAGGGRSSGIGGIHNASRRWDRSTRRRT